MSFHNDEDVMRYVDGTMDDDTAKQFKAEAQTDSELSNKIDAMRVSKLPYFTAYKNSSPPPLPENVKKTISNWVQVANDAPRKDPTTNKNIVSTVLVSSAICLSFLLGFAASKLTDNTALFNSVQFDNDASDTAWVQRIANYQTLYGENTVNTLEADHIRAHSKLNTLSVSSGLASHIPDLSEYGYNFVRVQELEYDDKPLVQLMYKSTGNKPLALSFMPSDGLTRLTLRFARHEDLTSASWRLPNQRFVVIAEEPTESLEQIAYQIQKALL